MKLFNKPWKKAVAIVFGVLFGIIILVIVFISPIAKWAIEKYDMKILGREITLNWCYVNPFTGYAHLSGVKLFEQNSDSVFVAIDGASVDFAMLKIPSKIYEISSLSISSPQIHLIQNRKQFNFDDIVQRFTPKERQIADSLVKSTKFNMLDVEISNAHFIYDEKVIPVHYWVKEMDLTSPGLRYDRDTIQFKTTLRSGPGSGDVHAEGTFNIKSLDYRVAAKVEKFDLSIFEQYLKDISNYGHFSANLDCDIHAQGNVKQTTDVAVQGYLAINDFHFGKKKGEDYVSLKKLAVNMTNVSPRTFDYNVDTVMIDQPYFKFERYDYLNNAETMFGKGGATVKAARADSSKFNLIFEIYDYLKKFEKNFLASHYHVNKFALYRGDIRYNDFALREEFSIAANPLRIIAKNIDKSNPRINVDVDAGLQPHGQFAFGFSVNPMSFGDFDLNLSLSKIAVPTFNPYTVTYTSYPLERGTMELTAKWKVRDSVVTSENHLLIVNPQLSKRVKKKDASWIPMPLIMAFVRDPGQEIDYDIPVNGNLKDPKFKIWPVVWEIVRNIFVKPPTSPYRVYVKNQEKSVEQFHIMRWNMRQSALTSKQKKFADDLIDFLKSNPEATIEIQPVHYEQKEREHMLLYEAKRYYFTSGKNFKLSEDDSIYVDKMSVKDSQFVHYLNNFVKQSDLLFTVQDKARVLVPDSKVNAKVAQLHKDRIQEFMAPFREAGVEKQMKILPSRDEVPRVGFSYYQINYKGDIPKKLQKALDFLDDADEDYKGYSKERKEVRSKPGKINIKL
ncbi:MAG: DUF748 domain-containing protein [Chitinophagales bacterium]